MQRTSAFEVLVFYEREGHRKKRSAWTKSDSVLVFLSSTTCFFKDMLANDDLDIYTIARENCKICVNSAGHHVPKNANVIIVKQTTTGDRTICDHACYLHIAEIVWRQFYVCP